MVHISESAIDGLELLFAHLYGINRRVNDKQSERSAYLIVKIL